MVVTSVLELFQGHKNSEQEEVPETQVETQDSTTTTKEQENKPSRVSNYIDNVKGKMPTFTKGSTIFLVIFIIVLIGLKVLELYALRKILPKGTSIFMFIIHVLLNILFGKLYYVVLIIVFGLRNFSLTKQVQQVIQQVQQTMS